MKRQFYRRASYDLAGEEGDLVNLTPLLDVLFVVLILFILIAPLVEIDRIELASTPLKKEELSPLNDLHPLKIFVKEDDSIWIKQNKVSLDQLAQILEALHKTSPGDIPQLYHDKQAHFGRYQEIRNLVEKSGFKELDVILKTE